MKKSLILLLTIVSAITLAQTKLNYGVKGGLNLSKIKDVHVDSEQRVAFHVGGFAQIPLQSSAQKFYIQPELLYTMMGEKDGSNNVNLDYLAVPVLFKAYFSEAEFDLFGEIGPQIGFLVSKSLPDNYNVYDHEFNSIDLGATVGIGVSYLRKWETSLRFYYGFSDVIEKDILDATNNNSNFSLGIAYMF